MAYESITYERDGRLAVITINRPEVRNALHPPANRELSAASSTTWCRQPS